MKKKTKDIKNCFSIIYKNCHKTKELEKIPKAFFWKNSTPEIKHETLSNNYKAVGLKC